LIVLTVLFFSLQEDPALLLDIKEDIREEAASFGDVTNVVLYDLEPSGVVTVRFAEPESASLCASKLNGRGYAKRKIIAYVPEHKEQFSKTSKAGQDGLYDVDEDDIGEEDTSDPTYSSAVEGQKTLIAEGTEKKGNNVDGGLKTMEPRVDATA